MEGNKMHLLVFFRSFWSSPKTTKPFSLCTCSLTFSLFAYNLKFSTKSSILPSNSSDSRGHSPISPEKWRTQHNHFRMSAVSFGALVTLQELNSGSPLFKQGSSLRVTGKLQEYNVETAIAILIDGGATLKIDTEHLRLNFRVGSIYQFIGELHIQPDKEGVLKARVGRNVDGMDLNLYRQSLQLLREFQADQSHL